MALVGKKEDMNSLIARLEKYPYNSKPYKELLKAIAKQCEGKYKDQAILCVPRTDIPTGSISLHPGDDKSSYIGSIFDMEPAFDEEKTVTYRPRNEVEYDMGYKQVIACAYVTDGDRYLFLRKKNKSKQVSLVGGHVDFDISAYRSNLSDFIRDNLLRELDEEVSVEGGWASHIRMIVPELYTNEYIDSYDQYNLGVVFSIHVDNLAKLKPKSGEPDNHEIIIGTLEDITTTNVTHLWVNRVIEHIQHIIDSGFTILGKGETYEEISDRLNANSK